MKRWAILGMVLAALLLSQKNAAGTNIAELEPVGALRARSTGGMLILETDSGQYGAGSNITEAVADMNETASGQVFLETAEYLLVTPSAVKWLPELAESLRPACRICLDTTGQELAAAAEYLAIHKPEISLRLFQQGRTWLQVLYLKEGRMYLGKP